MDEIEESRLYKRLSFRFFTRQDLLLKAPILHQIFQDALFNTLELLGSVIVPVISLICWVDFTIDRLFHFFSLLLSEYLAYCIIFFRRF